MSEKGSNVNAGINCYNRSELGHLAQDCMKERRPIGSCFKCGKMEHYYVNCPVRMVNYNVQVRVTFFDSSGHETKSNIMNSLLDTGRPNSFVKGYCPVGRSLCITGCGIELDGGVGDRVEVNPDLSKESIDWVKCIIERESILVS